MFSTRHSMRMLSSNIKAKRVKATVPRREIQNTTNQKQNIFQPNTQNVKYQEETTFLPPSPEPNKQNSETTVVEDFFAGFICLFADAFPKAFIFSGAISALLF